MCSFIKLITFRRSRFFEIVCFALDQSTCVRDLYLTILFCNVRSSDLLCQCSILIKIKLSTCQILIRIVFIVLHDIDTRLVAWIIHDSKLHNLLVLTDTASESEIRIKFIALRSFCFTNDIPAIWQQLACCGTILSRSNRIYRFAIWATLCINSKLRSSKYFACRVCFFNLNLSHHYLIFVRIGVNIIHTCSVYNDCTFLSVELCSIRCLYLPDGVCAKRQLTALGSAKLVCYDRIYNLAAFFYNLESCIAQIYFFYLASIFGYSFLMDLNPSGKRFVVKVMQIIIICSSVLLAFCDMYRRILFLPVSRYATARICHLHIVFWRLRRFCLINIILHIQKINENWLHETIALRCFDLPNHI